MARTPVKERSPREAAPGQEREPGLAGRIEGVLEWAAEVVENVVRFVENLLDRLFGDGDSPGSAQPAQEGGRGKGGGGGYDTPTRAQQQALDAVGYQQPTTTATVDSSVNLWFPEGGTQGAQNYGELPPEKQAEMRQTVAQYVYDQTGRTVHPDNVYIDPNAPVHEGYPPEHGHEPQAQEKRTEEPEKTSDGKQSQYDRELDKIEKGEEARDREQNAGDNTREGAEAAAEQHAQDDPDFDRELGEMLDQEAAKDGGGREGAGNDRAPSRDTPQESGGKGASAGQDGSSRSSGPQQNSAPSSPMGEVEHSGPAQGAPSSAPPTPSTPPAPSQDQGQSM